MLPQRSKHPREMVITPKASTSMYTPQPIQRGSHARKQSPEDKYRREDQQGYGLTRREDQYLCIEIQL